MVGAPYQGAGNNLQKTQVLGLGLQVSEFGGRHIAKDVKLASGGLQVLAEGENVDAMLTKVGKNLPQLIPGLTQAKHKP